MTIIGIARINSGVDYHRVYNPLRHLPLDKKDMVIFLNEGSKHTEEMFEAADILVVNRHFPSYSIDDLDKIVSYYNLKLVVDLDDYWELYKNHIIYKDWMKGEMPHRIIETLKRADLITVTHEKLANEVFKISSGIEIFPNAIPIDTDQFVYNPISEDVFNIIYGGGNSHLFDLKSVGNLFLRLGSDGNFKKKAKFLLAGYHNPDNDKRNIWHQIEAVVKPAKKYELIEALPCGEYMSMYDRANLSIAPLENNTFNSFKSNIKTIEAGCKHIPIVASNMHPYTLDKDTQGVTLCNSVSEWYKAINYYVNNPNAAKDDGEALYEYVYKNYNLSNFSQKRYDLLKSLL
jgi:glycosyltransferase involved in cell wall biosynthesis